MKMMEYYELGVNDAKLGRIGNVGSRLSDGSWQHEAYHAGYADASELMFVVEAPWIEYKGQDTPTPPTFNDNDRVEVIYRDGRRSGPEREPWMFAGWQWTSAHPSRNNIVRYRIVK